MRLFRTFVTACAAAILFAAPAAAASSEIATATAVTLPGFATAADTITCTGQFGIFSATWQSGYLDWNITWGARTTCTDPRIVMNGDATLSHEGVQWASTGVFTGEGSMERIIPSDHVPSGSWTTSYRKTLFAPPGYTWQPGAGNCTGYGTERLDCLSVASQTLTPPQ